MWEGIRRAGAVTDLFDFEGSMRKPLERFSAPSAAGRHRICGSAD
jgi:hypothetical protein